MFAQWLQEQLNAHGWTAERLALQTGLSRSHVYKLLNPKYEVIPNRSTVIRIAQSLRVSPVEALRAAGYASSSTLLTDSASVVAEMMDLLANVREADYYRAILFFQSQIQLAKQLFVPEHDKEYNEHGEVK